MRDPIYSQAHIRAQRGISLVELMVALVIALILTAGVIQIFLGSQQTYRFHESMSRVQENARFAVDALAHDVREAGGYGCMRNLRLETPPEAGVLRNGFLRVTLSTYAEWEWDFSRPVEGFSGTGTGFSPALPAGFPASVRADSDVIMLRGTQGGGMVVTAHPGGTPPGSANIQLDAENGFSQGEIVMVGDCTSAAVFQITNSNPNTSGTLAHNTGATVAPGNWTAALGRDFERDGEVMRMRAVSYFVADGASGLPSLFVRNNALASQELIEGVERMRISYGVDDGADRAVDRYLTAEEVESENAWPNVAAVRISLLLMSPQDNVLDGAQPVTFDGVTYTPADRRLRQVVTTTIGLRNRLP